jgi:hypothetical protein
LNGTEQTLEEIVVELGFQLHVQVTDTHDEKTSGGEHHAGAEDAPLQLSGREEGENNTEEQEGNLYQGEEPARPRHHRHAFSSACCHHSVTAKNGHGGKPY